MRLSLIAFLLVCSVSAAFGQIRASINQGFELPTRATLPPGAINQDFGIAYNLAESYVPGWNSTHPLDCSGEPCIEIWDNGTANSGNQHIELNANSPSAAYLGNVCLINGETLDWSFYHKNRSDGADTVRMQATDGINTQILTDQTTSSTTVWANNADSEVITLPTGNYDIQFVGIVPTGSLGNFLDDISLTLTPLLEFDLASYTETEGDAVTVPQIVISGLVPSGGFTIPVSVVAGGTTASPSDYTLSSTVFIPAGVYDGGASSRFDINITLTEDTEIEPNETVEIEVGGGAGYDIAPIQCSGSAKTTAVYTIRDDDARLTLEKSVVNDNGGTHSDDTSWTLAFDGGSAAVGIANGIEGSAAVTNANITEGTFALSETGGPFGYALGNLSCAGAADTSTSVVNPNVTIVPGELVTCSFTNNDIAPQLTLVKNVVGGAASMSDFTLSFSGSSSGSGVSGDAAITNVNLDAGTFTISESAVEFYDGVLSCAGAADGNPNDGLTLAIGEVVTCTFTNTFNPNYDFSVTKSVTSGPTTALGQNGTIVDAGDQISYSIVVSNTGNAGLINFALTESLAGVSIICATSGNNTISSLAFGTSETCNATYTLIQSDFDTNGGGDGDIDNTVTATADGGGSTVSRGGSTSTPIIQISEIEVSKVADDDDEVEAGQDITYTYSVTNTGNTTISAISLLDAVTAGSGSDPVPDNEALATPGGVAVSVTTTDSTTNQVWDALGPGDIVEFTGIYTVTQSDIDDLQ